jgi:hypothetical protein
VIRSKPIPLCLVSTRTLKLSVKFPCDKLENQLNLQDGDIDHRQHAEIHSDSSQRNVEKDSTTLENSNVDKFVITDDKRTTTAIHNQKHYSFSISSATCYHHIMFHQTPHPQSMLILYLDWTQPESILLHSHSHNLTN